MEATLKRLLAAEQEANRITEEANNLAEQLLHEADREAQTLNQRFLTHLPELHTAFAEKAEERAQQAQNELRRRYEERMQQLRETAQSREAAALNAAFAELLKTDVSSQMERGRTSTAHPSG